MIFFYIPERLTLIVHPHTNFPKGPSQRQSGQEIDYGQCIEETSLSGSDQRDT